MRLLSLHLPSIQVRTPTIASKVDESFVNAAGFKGPRDDKFPVNILLSLNGFVFFFELDKVCKRLQATDIPLV